MSSAVTPKPLRLWILFLTAPTAIRNWPWTVPVPGRTSNARRAMKPSPFPRRTGLSNLRLPPPSLAASPISTSAAAKMELHLKVPVRDKSPAPLIAKPKPPLEAVVRGAGKKILSHTIKHAACVESRPRQVRRSRHQIFERGGRDEHHRHAHDLLHASGHRHAKNVERLRPAGDLPWLKRRDGPALTCRFPVANVSA